MLTANYFTRLGIVAVISGSLFATPPALAAYAKYYQFGVWKVSVKPDSFTGRNICTLKAKGIYYRNGIVGFQFGERTDTRSAEFRINGGSVQEARDYEASVKADKLFYETGPLENPDGGIVSLPAQLFTQANFVYVRPNDQADSKRFRLDGLGKAQTFLSQQNCL